VKTKKQKIDKKHTITITINKRKKRGPTISRIRGEKGEMKKKKNKKCKNVCILGQVLDMAGEDLREGKGTEAGEEE